MLEKAGRAGAVGSWLLCWQTACLLADECASQVRMENWVADCCVEKRFAMLRPVGRKRRLIGSMEVETSLERGSRYLPA